ncbi:uncharacterized protein K452DRAFT_357209 [Aplosporella prunicola CBS 121167]|uniref:Uncharacterized protein n=1 Tax=Aplosporella prunicola CBS 121167 TaxID=1176127 RepID=A0A6A6BJH9_9PEZI|nr:uncharacterized protein K452DRAFT_357209 [Aplosporella prunicola CBS 121167]KAF2143533.1 hypothetical protein K452DRAFT_357209 [Aplosporella prunicola CBS 121167]
MSAALHRLPTELVELTCILGALSKADISSLRLVCRQLAKQVTPAFFQVYLDTITTDLSPKSLSRLEEISQHAQARQAVRTLVIDGMLSLPTELGSIELGQNIPGPWHRSSQGFLEPPFPAEIERLLHHTLIGGLPNCRSFVLSDNDGEKEGVNIDWVPLSDILALLLHCISEYRLPIKSFAIDFTILETEMIDITRFSTDVYRSSRFEEVWANHLQDLYLNFNDLRDLDRVQDFVTTIVARARNLRKLSLNFSAGFNADLVNDLLSFSPAWRPPLYYLSIRHVIFKDVDQFLGFLSLFRDTLRCFSSRLLGLRTGSWRQALPALTQTLPHLDELDIGSFSECIRISQHRLQLNYCYFCPIRNEPYPEDLELIAKAPKRGALITGVKYKGRSVDTVLELLVKTGYVFTRDGKISWSEQ